MVRSDRRPGGRNLSPARAAGALRRRPQRGGARGLAQSSSTARSTTTGATRAPSLPPTAGNSPPIPYRSFARGPGLGRGRARPIARHVRRHLEPRDPRALLRDFFGIVFYSPSARALSIFASEIKSILEHPAYERAQRGRPGRISLLPVLGPARNLLQGRLQAAAGPLPARACRRHHQRAPLLAPQFTLSTAIAAKDAVDNRRGHARERALPQRGRRGRFVERHRLELPGGLPGEGESAIHTFSVGFSFLRGQPRRGELGQGARRLHFGVANASKHIRQENFGSPCRAQGTWTSCRPTRAPCRSYFVDWLAAQQVKAVPGEGAEPFGGYCVYQAPLASRRLGWAPSGFQAGGAGPGRARGQLSGTRERAGGGLVLTPTPTTSPSRGRTRDRSLRRPPAVPDPSRSWRPPMPKWPTSTR